MFRWPKTLALLLLSAGVLIFGSAPALEAATSSTLDILSNDAADSRDTVDIGSVKPLARPNREAAKPIPGGNPLWSVPLSALRATQERPIFSASRRPAQPAVVAPPMELASAPPPQVAGPENPPLALIGAVVGDSDSIAIFFDSTNQKVVRLRQGEAHAGWMLSAVQGREVTLKKAERTEILALKANDSPRGPPGLPVLPMPTAIGAGGTDGNYAPFIPRSTPKNGESDGL